MNKYFIAIFFIFFITHLLSAQSMKGITGKPDTSFTTYKAYNDIKKSHPNVLLSWVPEKTTQNVCEQRNVAYDTVTGRSLQLDVFSPKKNRKQKRVGILIVHGGGWRTGNRSQHIPLAQHLAALGYVCVTAEYRLSTEALYPAGVYDLKNAVKWMRAHAKDFNLDTNRIAVLGFSAGGQLAALIGATNANPKFESPNTSTNPTSANIQAVIDIDGILAFIHPESGEGDDMKSTSAATYWFGYSKLQNAELWNEGSALTHVNEKTPPTLFLNSSVVRMHAGREDYRKKLDAHKIYSEVHTFSDAPHSFCLFHPWFNQTVKLTDDFLKKIFK